MTKRAKRVSARTDSEKLEEIIRLLQLSIAVDLYKSGVSQQQISKNLGVATIAVNKILKGVEKE